MVAADLDHDGDLDVLAASAWDNTVAWHENLAGDGSAWSEHEITIDAVGAAAVAAADLDHDGDLDVLAASTWDDTVAWHENLAGDGSAWSEREIAIDAAGAAGVAAADLDHDGDLDALSAAAYDGRILWHENLEGDGSAWATHVISLQAAGAASVAAADVDCDGDLDALSASTWDDRVAWHENLEGDGSAWATHTISLQAAGAASVAAADVDGDGDLDALSASLYDDTVAWYQNPGNGGAGWTRLVITGEAFGASSVTAADLDEDGDLDAVSAATWDDEVAWHRREEAASPGWETSVIAFPAAGASAVFLADLDQDGDLDVLSAWRHVNTIAWHENLGAGFPLVHLDGFESGTTARWSVTVEGSPPTPPGD